MKSISHAKQFARYWLVKAMIKHLDQIATRFPETAELTATICSLAYQLETAITNHTETTIKPWLTKETKPRRK